jgi:hypothetical protein
MRPLLIWKRLLSYFRCIDNYCKRCGRRTEAWHSPDGLYNLIIPDGMERCFRCFDRAARKEGLHPVWNVTADDL